MASWFGGGWFGGQKSRDTPKKAILGLRSQLEMLSKREKHLETQIEDQDNLARKHVSSNKNGTSTTPVMPSTSLMAVARNTASLVEYQADHAHKQLPRLPCDGRSSLSTLSSRHKARS
jgi:hypothetical protein